MTERLDLSEILFSSQSHTNFEPILSHLECRVKKMLSIAWDGTAGVCCLKQDHGDGGILIPLVLRLGEVICVGQVYGFHCKLPTVSGRAGSQSESA